MLRGVLGLVLRGALGLALGGVLGVAATGLTPAAASAQIKASERSTVSQTIDGTTITIDYSRPSLRGRLVREDLFGEQIHWGHIWTPGANNATTFEVDKDVRLAGIDVPAGTYSVWMKVEDGPWTLILDPRSDLYHLPGPGENEDQLTAQIETTIAPYSVETLSWSIPTVRRDGADLRFQWGDLAVDLNLEVEPSVVVTTTPEEAAPYLGMWQVEQLDTNYGSAHSYVLEVRHENEILLAEMEFGPDFSMDIAFVAAAEQVFKMGILMEGDVSEVNDYMTMEFVMGDDGLAESFEQRGPDDTLVLTGRRIR